MELFNIIAGLASIIGLVVALFVASKVIKITNTINNSKNSGINQTNEIEGHNNPSTQVVGDGNSVR